MVSNFAQTFTLTFCETAENHKGMQQIGKITNRGFSLEELEEIQIWFEANGIETELVHLNKYLPEDLQTLASIEDAYILICKNGLGVIVDPDELYEEHLNLEKDSKAFMYGRVVNKKARHNLCFADFSQEADYANKKGTVIHFNDVPITKMVRNTFSDILSEREEMHNLFCEGNYYYDKKKTYIGFHGDTERRLVIGARLGADFNIYYQWYHRSKPIGQTFIYTLSHGDMYFMSDKAVGYDWRSSSKYTLRHAAALDSKLVLK